jgi:hypothetical protein
VRLMRMSRKAPNVLRKMYRSNALIGRQYPPHPRDATSPDALQQDL